MRTLQEYLACIFMGFVTGYLVAAVMVARHWGWLP